MLATVVHRERREQQEKAALLAQAQMAALYYNAVYPHHQSAMVLTDQPGSVAIPVGMESMEVREWMGEMELTLRQPRLSLPVLRPLDLSPTPNDSSDLPPAPLWLSIPILIICGSAWLLLLLALLT